MVPGVCEERGGYSTTTSDYMEITAIVKALLWLRDRGESGTIYSDSQSAIQSIYRRIRYENCTAHMVRGEYKYRKIIKRASKLLGESEVLWVRGHAGDRQNERSDALARLAAEEAKRDREGICRWSGEG